jgi:hypothetical protein
LAALPRPFSLGRRIAAGRPLRDAAVAHFYEALAQVVLENISNWAINERFIRCRAWDAHHHP